MLNFVSIYNLFTPTTLFFDNAGYQQISVVTNLLNELIFMNLSVTILRIPKEQEEESRLRILHQLEETKMIWNLFEAINIKLKQNIINALHYFYYGKMADRDEEKIVNYITGFECLFLEDNRELSYKLSMRSSYILSKYVK